MNPQTLTLFSDAFPGCDTHFMPQRSSEWFEARRGRLTASTAGAWLLDVPKVRLKKAELVAILIAEGVTAFDEKAKVDDLVALLPNPQKYESDTATTRMARTAALGKLLSEIAECETKPDFDNWEMKRGTALEPLAVESFEKALGVTVDEVGFCASRHGAFGCSPDGLVLDGAFGLEGKAPDPVTHFKYLLDPSALLADYGMQVEFSMAVTGARSWWLQSFCPNQPAVRLEVRRSEKTERLIYGLIAFSDRLDDARDMVREAWDAQFNPQLEEIA